MTEFEHAILFYEIINNANSSFNNFMTIVFAMLTASYFLAHKLNRTMCAILLFIYSMWAFRFANELWQVYSDFARLGSVLHELGQMPDTNLGWMGPVISSGNMSSIPIFILFNSGTVFLATLAFFFIVRRMRIREDIENANAGASAP